MADITRPFDLQQRNRQPVRFHIISAWEVPEHISGSSLPGLAGNVLRHLAEDGLLIASVATFEGAAPNTGAVWHQTIRPRSWWMAKLREWGLGVIDSHGFDTAEFVRGSSNPTAHDWSAATNPELGFHVVTGAL
jgi:hypothetical protein